MYERLSAAKLRSTQSSLESSVDTYARERKKPVFVQANSNSGEGHVLHYITSFCVVSKLSTLSFWLAGKTETKQVVNRISKWVEGGGSWKGHESGHAVFFFLQLRSLFSRASRANFAVRGFAARAPGSTKPPCYAGYRRHWKLIHYAECSEFICAGFKQNSTLSKRLFPRWVNWGQWLTCGWMRFKRKWEGRQQLRDL